MRLYLLVDFGSTYTKLRVVDIDHGMIVATAQSPTTVATDMTIGFEKAREILKNKLGHEFKISKTLACSSAAGGLRLAAIGLVPSLTCQAAKMAALGAGAKVVATYSFKLTQREIRELERLSPDIVLLAGGTDGGDTETIIWNARMLASSSLDTPILVAGNKSASDSVETILGEARKQLRMTENVMPQIDVLNLEPARSQIRDIFMTMIVRAKGLDQAERLVGSILMPTPVATLNAAKLLADGTSGQAGLGPLIVIEVGGATVNVHSVCDGRPSHPDVMVKGLPEPYVKRTVEADLGIRYSARDIVDSLGERRLIDSLPIEVKDTISCESLRARIDVLSQRADSLSNSAVDCWIDAGLTRAAVDEAIGRHAGRIEPFYSASGIINVQQGKDLSQVKTVVGTGGVFSCGIDPVWSLQTVQGSQRNTFSLRPKDPHFLVDSDYALFACGLLAETAPDTALSIMKNSLNKRTKQYCWQHRSA